MPVTAWLGSRVWQNTRLSWQLRPEPRMSSFRLVFKGSADEDDEEDTVASI